MPRKPGYKHTERTRDKIKATSLVNRLHKVAMGEVDADPTQVNAAKALLNKVLPDLKSTELSGSLSMTKDPSELTDEELAAHIPGDSGATSSKA